MPALATLNGRRVGPEPEPEPEAPPPPAPFGLDLPPPLTRAQARPAHTYMQFLFEGAQPIVAWQPVSLGRRLVRLASFGRVS